MRTILALAATLMLATGAAAANSAAPPRMVPAAGLTLADVQSWLQESGYKAKIETADDGSKYIESGSDGLIFDIDMYDCDNAGRCKSFKFVAWFTAGSTPFDLAVTNNWNMQMRWTSAYIYTDGSAVIQQDINLPDNTSYAALENNLNIWLGMLREFADFIYKPAGGK